MGVRWKGKKRRPCLMKGEIGWKVTEKIIEK